MHTKTPTPGFSDNEWIKEIIDITDFVKAQKENLDKRQGFRVIKEAAIEIPASL